MIIVVGGLHSGGVAANDWPTMTGTVEQVRGPLVLPNEVLLAPEKGWGPNEDAKGTEVMADARGNTPKKPIPCCAPPMGKMEESQPHHLTPGQRLHNNQLMNHSNCPHLFCSYQRKLCSPLESLPKTALAENEWSHSSIHLQEAY